MMAVLKLRGRELEGHGRPHERRHGGPRWGVAAAARKARQAGVFRIWPFRDKTSILGLDIGFDSIKAIVLEKKDGDVAVKQAGTAEMPAEATMYGVLTDGVMIACEIEFLVSQYGLTAKKTAVSAGGEKVYCQMDRMSSVSGDQGKTELERCVGPVIPYPFERAAVDCQVIDEESPGDDVRALWVSAAVERVDWLRETVSLAGLTPHIVDTEPCALANAFIFNHQPGPDEISLLMHVGARQATLSLMKGENLLYGRGVAISKERDAYDPEVVADGIWEMIDQHMLALQERSGSRSMDGLYLSGGAVRLPLLVSALQTRTSIPVSLLDPFKRVRCDPDNAAKEVIEEQGPALAVAVGLALRSFDDL